MTFDEIPMYQAIADVYFGIPQPGADLVESEFRPIAMQILDSMIDCHGHGVPLPSVSTLMIAWRNFRKSKANTRITVEVGNAHGWKCFHADRGRGPCSNNVRLTRISTAAPDAEITVENGLIVCASHLRESNDQQAASADDQVAEQPRDIEEVTVGPEVLTTIGGQDG